MIRVIASMGCKIESDRQPALACRQIAPVEGVGLLGSRETGILANGPAYMVARGPLT